jgi:ketosteroid isomerase-like protein
MRPVASFPRAEIEAAFARTREAQDRNDWSGYADCFSEDAVYVEHQFGVFRGREAIRKWLVEVMAPFREWTFPTEWLVIDGDRLVFLWWNRLPGERPDGTRYEFSGVTTMVYAGRGQFSLQEDIYNFEETRRVMKEWAAAQKK